MSMFRVFRQLFSTTPSPERQAKMADAGKKVQQIIDDNAVGMSSPHVSRAAAGSQKTKCDCAAASDDWDGSC